MLLKDFKLRNAVNVATLAALKSIEEIPVSQEEGIDEDELKKVIDIERVTDENAVETLIFNLLNVRDYLCGGGDKMLALLMVPSNLILDDDLCADAIMAENENAVEGNDNE